jgi:outer membrane protein OmpA-like peptidoglycan-associated protein
MEKSSIWLAAGVAIAALYATPALAQSGVDGHGFGLTAQDGDPRDPLSVERPGKMTGGEWYTSALFEMASGTMDQIVRNPDGTVADDGRSTYLTGLMGANLVGGAAFSPAFRLDVRMPVFFSAKGFNANDPAGQPIGGGTGNMRVALMAAPLTPDDDGGFGLGIVPWVDLPTASAGKNMGYAKLAGGTKLAMSVEAGKLTLGGDIGIGFRPQVADFENIIGADQLMAGIAAGFLFNDNIGLNLEANFNPSLAGSPEDAIDGVPGWAESPSEALMSLRGRTNGGMHWTVGGATALSPGIGAAKYRVFVGAGFGEIKGTGTPKIGDADKDGIMDDVDKCPAEPEVVNDYQDLDGCPDKLGNLSISAKQYYEVVSDLDITITGMGEVYMVKTSSEPVGVADLMPGAYDVRTMDSNYEGNIQIRVKEGTNKVELEVVKTTPGTLSVKAIDGDGNPVGSAMVTVAAPGGGQGKEFTLDAEGVGKLDMAPGYYSVFVQKDGYGIFREDTSMIASDVTEVVATLTKARTEVKKESIDILEKVFFQKGSAVIQARSFPLLDEIANVLLRNSGIKRIEVAGHTSSEGSLEFNNKLSTDRATSVLNYLIERGVSEIRLHAKGYGPSSPLVSEKSEADRAKNRRVEFNILKRK